VRIGSIDSNQGQPQPGDRQASPSRHGKAGVKPESPSVGQGPHYRSPWPGPSSKTSASPLLPQPEPPCKSGWQPLPHGHPPSWPRAQEPDPHCSWGWRNALAALTNFCGKIRGDTLIFRVLESTGLTPVAGSEQQLGWPGPPRAACTGLLGACASPQRAAYLEEPVALHYHVGQALRRCQVLTQLPLVRFPQAVLPLTGSVERGRRKEGRCCDPPAYRVPTRLACPGAGNQQRQQNHTALKDPDIPGRG